MSITSTILAVLIGIDVAGLSEITAGTYALTLGSCLAVEFLLDVTLAAIASTIR